MDEFVNAIHSKPLLASGPSCWGPLQWMTLHQIARGYPRENPTEEQKKAARDYVMSLIWLLPCSICGQHWKEIAPTVRVDNRNEFLKWTIDVHNAVNARNGRKVLSYADAIQTIQSTCKNNVLAVRAATPNTTEMDNTAIIVFAVLLSVFVILSVVFIVLYFKCKGRGSKR